MSMQAKKWRPLQVAIAWVVTRDEQFCDTIANDGSALQRTFCGSARLEHEMMEAGCFDEVEGILKFEPPAPTITILRHSIKPNYRGRFCALAEDYGDGGQLATDPHSDLPQSIVADGVSVGDFLAARWHDAFRLIAERVADGEIAARGVALDGERRQPAGNLPAASFNRGMWMDLEGLVWEGPQIQSVEHPRRWDNIAINWEDLQTCFSPHRTAAEEAFEFDFDRDETADPSRYNPLNERVWTLPMVLAWIMSGDIDRVRLWWDDARRSLPGSCGCATIRAIVVLSEVEQLRKERAAGRNYFRGGIRYHVGDGYGGDPATTNPAEIAFRKLRGMASSNKLDATGVPVNGGHREPIECHRWHDLRMKDCKKFTHGPEVPTVARPDAWQSGWTDLLFPSEVVQSLWPSQASAGKVAVAKVRRLPPAFEKIRAAIAAEFEATGQPFPTLRPVERNKRLSDRMREMGLKHSEIPGERAFRDYFNKGPGKSEKSG